MKPLLVTASLLNAWEWFMQDESANAVAVFEKVLRRESTPDNEAMQAGRAFETRVRIAYNQDDTSWMTARDIEDLNATKEDAESDAYLKCVEELADVLRGGIWQVSLSKVKEIAGQEFCLYGRLDVLKYGIIDLKFSHTFAKGKYLDSPQTIMYFALAENAPWFEYFICDGSTVMSDGYVREDVQPIESLVSRFWQWLEAFPNFKALYLENWESKGDK